MWLGLGCGWTVAQLQGRVGAVGSGGVLGEAGGKS